MKSQRPGQCLRLPLGTGHDACRGWVPPEQASRPPRADISAEKASGSSPWWSTVTAGQEGTGDRRRGSGLCLEEETPVLPEHFVYLAALLEGQPGPCCPHLALLPHSHHPGDCCPTPAWGRRREEALSPGCPLPGRPSGHRGQQTPPTSAPALPLLTVLTTNQYIRATYTQICLSRDSHGQRAAEVQAAPGL